MIQEKIIVWFKKDLRISDNPALSHATAKGMVVPIYIFDESEADDFKMGQGARWWLYKSLQVLSVKLDNKLFFFKGNSERIIEDIVKDIGASCVYLNRSHEPWLRQQEIKIQKKLLKKGIDV